MESSPRCSAAAAVLPIAALRAFFECGILAHGFLRLRRRECGHDKRLAFRCKRPGFCPSCGARRMSQKAAQLVDHVIPHALARQTDEAAIVAAAGPCEIERSSKPGAVH